MWVWTTRETLRCPDLLARCGDQLVCMRDVFMFIFIHSVVELVGSLHIDLCGLMVSLFVYADVAPRPPPRHRRRVVTIAPAVVPVRSSRRRQRNMDVLVSYMEQLATRVLDDG